MWCNVWMNAYLQPCYHWIKCLCLSVPVCGRVWWDIRRCKNIPGWDWGRWYRYVFVLDWENQCLCCSIEKISVVHVTLKATDEIRLANWSADTRVHVTATHFAYNGNSMFEQMIGNDVVRSCPQSEWFWQRSFWERTCAVSKNEQLRHFSLTFKKRDIRTWRTTETRCSNSWLDTMWYAHINDVWAFLSRYVCPKTNASVQKETLTHFACNVNSICEYLSDYRSNGTRRRLHIIDVASQHVNFQL